MLFNLVVIIHVITCLLLMVVVLMQSSKGGGLSGAFGGGGGQAIMGGRETASFLSKATTYLAIIFMITSLSLAFLSASNRGAATESALRKAAQREQWGGIVPEEQKNIDDVLGDIPEPAAGGQDDGTTDQEPSKQETE